MSGLLGRTNEVWPTTWWVAPTGPGLEQASDWLAALSEPQPVIDVSDSTALWGHVLAGRGVRTVYRGTPVATGDPELACHQVEAEIIQVVSCLGGRPVDLWAARVDQVLEQAVGAGVVKTLVEAAEDGLIRHLGLVIPESSIPARSLWRWHDAFSVVLVAPGVPEDVLTEARNRRCGVIGLGESRSELVDGWLRPAVLPAEATRK